MMRLFLLGVFVVLGNVYGYSQEQSRIIKDARSLASYIDYSESTIADMFVDSMSKKNDPYTERFYKNSLNNSLTKVELYKPGQKFTATYYFQNEKLIYVKGNDTSGSDPLLLEIVFKNEKLVHVSHMGACGPGGMPQRLIDESKSYLLYYKLFHKMPH
jgi:hypothetical protein